LVSGRIDIDLVFLLHRNGLEKGKVMGEHFHISFRGEDGRRYIDPVAFTYQESAERQARLIFLPENAAQLVKVRVGCKCRTCGVPGKKRGEKKHE
jgi:hypothetical protein